MARLQLNGKKAEAVKKLISTAAATGGPMGAKAAAGRGSEMPEFQGQKMDPRKPLQEVVVTGGPKEKAVLMVGGGAGSHTAATPLFATMVREYVKNNPKWQKYIDISSTESVAKSLKNFKDVYEFPDKKVGKRGRAIATLYDLGREIEKKYFQGSGTMGDIVKKAKIGVYERNPDFEF